MPYKQQSHRLRSGEQGGHNSLLVVLSPKTLSEWSRGLWWWKNCVRICVPHQCPFVV